MKPFRDARERQKSTVFVALLLFSLVLIVLQLWLFVAVLENLLSGHATMAIPAAGASAVILAIQAWMLLGVYRMDRQA
ncbi:MAG TPA: hypothetical protein PLX06_07380 [Fimbriimonadaceae bacterium]|nr:hypothetical protein [Fimbriimonadaceae bacterium]